MVTTDKANWTSNLNIDLGGIASTRQAQYQTTLIRLKEFFEAAGWVRQGSSNGTTASTADNWGSSTANIVAAVAPSARSWYAFGAPSGATFANNTVGTYSILLEASAGTVGNLYQTFNIYVSTTAFTGFTSTTVLPTGTATGTSGSAPTARAQTMPYNAAADTSVQTYLNTWYNAAGDLYFILKQSGAPAATTRFTAFIDATLARTNTNRLIYFLASGTSFNANLSPIHGFSTENLSAGVSLAISSRGSLMSSWPLGQDSTGNLGYFPTFAYANGSTAVLARDYGRLYDFWSLPGTSPGNATDASDTDAVRLLTFADIALPTTFSQTPIL